MTPASERQKRLRARRRNGEVVALAPVNNRIIAMLIDLGWLAENESEDRHHIGAALVSMVADMEVFHSEKFSVTRRQPNVRHRGSIGSTATEHESES